MSAGMDALAEAARLESARIYSRTQREVDAAAAARPAPVDPAVPQVEAAVAYWHQRGQSTASIAFRLGVKRHTVVHIKERLGLAS